MPVILFAMLAMVTYGWSVYFALAPAVPLVLLFVFGWMGTAAYSGMNVLIVDLNLSSPATATAANNLVRCTLGALGAMTIMPIINTVGMGWTFVLISGAWIASHKHWVMARRYRPTVSSHFLLIFVIAQTRMIHACPGATVLAIHHSMGVI
jgi:hypothetical protein